MPQKGTLKRELIKLDWPPKAKIAAQSIMGNAM